MINPAQTGRSVATRGQKVSHNDMAKAVAAQMRLMEIEGLPMNKTDKRRWLMVLDTDATRKTAGSSSKTGSALAAELAKSGLRRVEDLPRLKAEAFKAGAAGKAFDAGGNVVIGLVQCYNIVKLVSDYQNQMKHEGHEPLARLATAGFAVLGSFGEATGLALQRMQEAGRLRNAAGLSLSEAAERMVRWGKRLGLITGLVVAGMDFLKSREASAAGDTGLSNAYFASFALGGSLAVAFFFSHLLGPIGWLIVGVAVIALLVLTLWIEKNKDNKIHEWLARCHFGSNPDKYKTEQEHAEQLKLAFA